MLGQRVEKPEGGTTEGQPLPARSLPTMLTFALAVAAAIGVGSWVASRAPIEQISGLPLPVPLVFGLLASAAVLLTLLVVQRLWELYRTQRQQISGAKMHRRLALILSTIALVPAAAAFLTTGVLLGALNDDFFVDRVEVSSNVARSLANAYTDSVSRQMGLTLLSVQREIARANVGGISPEASPIGYRLYLTGLAQIYQFGELTHISADGRVIVRANAPGLPPQPLPPASMLQLGEGSAGLQVRFGAVDPETLDIWFAVIPVGTADQGYLIGYRRENPVISNELGAVRDLRDDDRALRRRLGELSQVANIGFLLVTIVLLLGAAWIGLLVANAIVNPVKRLATAAQRVSQGDLASRVEVRKRDGELGDLGHAFNEMTEQLSEQREELIAAGEDAENRRRFIETMLGVIPAGVISVSREGDVGLANPSAAAILGRQPSDLLGVPLADISPAIARLFDEAKNSERGRRESLEWSRGGNLRSLIVEISPETEHNADTAGFVITIEDITELVHAQRTAAWGDVARRIAHEIKNPLTPIQLSAERLRRRYAGHLEGRDKEIFDQCTATIIRHVGDIGRMVTEFSSFARMPEPMMSENDLRDVAREALFPFAVAHPDITFVSHMPTGPVPVQCDGRLIVQALTNLIKNAAEAIVEADQSQQGIVEVEVLTKNGFAEAEVRDNGRGLPTELKHRLTEPYMTTREKGTGLGLAIVRKAVEDHDGVFEIIDRDGGGAIARISLPLLKNAANRGEPTLSSAPQQKPTEEPVHGH